MSAALPISLPALPPPLTPLSALVPIADLPSLSIPVLPSCAGPVPCFHLVASTSACRGRGVVGSSCAIGFLQRNRPEQAREVVSCLCVCDDARLGIRQCESSIFPPCLLFCRPCFSLPRPRPPSASARALRQPICGAAGLVCWQPTFGADTFSASMAWGPHATPSTAADSMPAVAAASTRCCLG